MNEVRVLPLVRAVANGADSKNQRIRVTLILSPRVVDSPDGFALAEWPQGAANWMRKHFEGPAADTELRLSIISSGNQIARTPAARISEFDLTPMEHVAWKDVNTFWQTCLLKEDDSGWRKLADNLDGALDCTSFKTTLKGKYDLPTQMPDHKHFDVDGALLASVDSSNPPVIGSIIPIKHADLAVDEERRRALRVMRKITSGPNSVPDDAPPAEKPDTSPPASDPKAFQEQVRAYHWTRFVSAVCATDGDRANSAAWYQAICSALENPDVDCSKLDYRDGDGGPIPDKSKCDPAACAADRASYVFGTWLQRRKDLNHNVLKNGSIERAGAAAISETLKTTVSEEADSRMLAIFHALQDDPVLSRVFVLAVDLDFAWPEGFSETDATYLHLLLGTRNGEEQTIVGAATHTNVSVATAAKLERDAFWPVSAFEAGIASKKTVPADCFGSLIEQENGIWCLGLGAPADTSAPVRPPRYDFVSLDVRRSVDSKRGNRDQGERQITSGLTVLDRGRAHQILRELALANRGSQCTGGPVILYAEDLTIGRRVDIAAARAGSDIDGVQWRGLMQRTVRYQFRGQQAAMQTAIAAFFAKASHDNNRMLVMEGSFQVVARHVPGVPPNDNSDPTWDVTADEAIFAWDGTPAGVLTDPGQPQASDSFSLPYQRFFDLPGLQDRHLLPPPLRYGVPYLLSMRSVFFGGGSPNREATHSFHSRTNGQHMLPPSRMSANGEKMVVAPRCFLRHASILAPTLLLPAHLAVLRDKVMGYEQLDQAIVRTGLASGQARGDDEDASYATLGQRLNPAHTMRVFVAPEASFEDVVRHGRLDVAEPNEVIRGGLLTVAYSYLHREPGATDSVVRGFPYVLTDRYASLEPDGVVERRREPKPAERSGASITGGIPLFQPGGPHNVPPGKAGWLPDPAVSQFVIRARLRGSDRYLRDCLEADLYDKGIRYPDALPLVVALGRKAGKRPGEPATSIHQLTGGLVQAPLKTVDSRGTVSSSRGSTQVRYFEFLLYEGEDFDLEVACLPSKDMLSGQFSLPETMAIQWMQASGDASAKENMEAFCGRIDLSVCKGVGKQFKTGLGGYAVPDDTLLQTCASTIIATMKTCWPVEEVSAVTRLRVCHAVNRPALAPLLLDPCVRRPLSPKQNDQFSSESPDAEKGTAVLLTGKVALDLDLTDAFEIIVESTATQSTALDETKRARSAISRRTGRWPTYTTPDGQQAYVSTGHVLGFSVAQNGRVELPRQRVTLLRVDNLPVAKAIGDIVKPGAAPLECGVRQDDTSLFSGEPVVAENGERRTALNLGVLHARAMLNQPIVMNVARPDCTEDVNPTTRTIRLSLPHIFADTRARELKVQVRGLSRFAETFETAPAYTQAGPRLLQMRQALSSRDQSTFSEVATVWSCATERPAACEPLRPEPAFLFDRSVEDDGAGGRIHYVERHTLTRLYFERGWFSSGEGERLGIVLWPPEYFDETKHILERNIVSVDGRSFSIARFEDKDLGVAGAYITRWGGDPIRKDSRPQEAVLIPTGAFADAFDSRTGECRYPALPHAPQVVPRAWMPVPTWKDPDEPQQPAVDSGKQDKDANQPGQSASNKQPEPDEFMPVTLLTYEPCFDIDREQWYVDVDLRGSSPSEPFVRFGLVRYQAHAVNQHLCVSVPVTVTVPLLPSRRLCVYLASPDASNRRHLLILLNGPGSSGIKDLQIEQNFGSVAKEEERDEMKHAFETLQRPWMRVWIFLETKDETGVLHREPIKTDAAFEGQLVQADVSGDELSWILEIDLPEHQSDSRRAGTLVAYVEEVDRRMPASYPREPVEPMAIFTESTFIDSGPRFSARVPLIEVNAAAYA